MVKHFAMSAGAGVLPRESVAKQLEKGLVMQTASNLYERGAALDEESARLLLLPWVNEMSCSLLGNASGKSVLDIVCVEARRAA